MPQKIIVGNWKMNGSKEALKELSPLAKAARELKLPTVMCLPATFLALLKTGDGLFQTGGQYCHPAAKGAYTGDISAEILKDAGARYVIVGHSERRENHNELDSDVAAQAQAAHRAGLTAIICVGENATERKNAETVAVVTSQVKCSLPATATSANTIIAYEPIWAIGTGEVATSGQISEVHSAIRDTLLLSLKGVPLIYGGSVNAENAHEIFKTENVDGALVGSASLTAAGFIPIMEALGRA